MAAKQMFNGENLFKLQCIVQARRNLVYSRNLNKDQSKTPAEDESIGMDVDLSDVVAPGLSTMCVTTNEPVGPGASKSGEYKVPEYYNFNKMSFSEAEVEMQRYRLEPPSALKKE